jgi:hypothetical protein
MDYNATAKSDRIKAESKDLCAVCQKMVWVSFYFDATQQVETLI